MCASTHTHTCKWTMPLLFCTQKNGIILRVNWKAALSTLEMYGRRGKYVISGFEQEEEYDDMKL